MRRNRPHPITVGEVHHENRIQRRRKSCCRHGSATPTPTRRVGRYQIAVRRAVSIRRRRKRYNQLVLTRARGLALSNPRGTPDNPPPCRGFIVFGFHQLRKSALPVVRGAGWLLSQGEVQNLGGRCRRKPGRRRIEWRCMAATLNLLAAALAPLRRAVSISSGQIPSIEIKPAANVSICFDSAWASCPSSSGTLVRSDSGPKNRG